MKKLLIFGLPFLAIIAILVASNFLKNKTAEDLLAPEDAKAMAEGFINKNLLKEGNQATISGIAEENGLYKIAVKFSNGQETNSYITKDGKKFFIDGLDISAVEEQAKQKSERAANTENQAGTESQATSTESQAPAAAEYAEDDKAKIAEFVNCLAEKNLKIYGANWCGWTKKLAVDTFGGFDKVTPIYVECTEKKDLCDQAGVSGYPTITINNEKYEGDRTFAAIAEATGCPAPDVQAKASASEEDASCN